MTSITDTKTHQIVLQKLAGWWFGTCFHFIYGMSAFLLTNSIMSQDGYYTTNQYVYIYIYYYYYYYIWDTNDTISLPKALPSGYLTVRHGIDDP